ncbi:unnamed protein product [Lota lota]
MNRRISSFRNTKKVICELSPHRPALSEGRKGGLYQSSGTSTGPLYPCSKGWCLVLRSTLFGWSGGPDTTLYGGKSPPGYERSRGPDTTLYGGKSPPGYGRSRGPDTTLSVLQLFSWFIVIGGKASDTFLRWSALRPRLAETGFLF